jgi:hypothetical protein
MERLATLEVSVGLFIGDVEWLQGAYGGEWTAKVRDLVHAAIRKIEIAAKIERFEAELTRQRNLRE